MSSCSEDSEPEVMDEQVRISQEEAEEAAVRNILYHDEYLSSPAQQPDNPIWCWLYSDVQYSTVRESIFKTYSHLLQGLETEKKRKRNGKPRAKRQKVHTGTLLDLVAWVWVRVMTALDWEKHLDRLVDLPLDPTVKMTHDEENIVNGLYMILYQMIQDRLKDEPKPSDETKIGLPNKPLQLPECLKEDASLGMSYPVTVLRKCQRLWNDIVVSLRRRDPASSSSPITRAMDSTTSMLSTTALTPTAHADASGSGMQESYDDGSLPSWRLKPKKTSGTVSCNITEGAHGTLHTGKWEEERGAFLMDMKIYHPEFRTATTPRDYWKHARFGCRLLLDRNHPILREAEKIIPQVQKLAATKDLDRSEKNMNFDSRY